MAGPDLTAAGVFVSFAPAAFVSRPAPQKSGKIYILIDSVRRRRSDGAMVRIMVANRSSKEQAEKIAIEMASRAAPELNAFVPN